MKKLKLFALATVAFLGFSGAANAETVLLASDDFVGISFWIIAMGMAAATVFFFMERGTVHPGWKTSVTVAGLVTGVAFVHYMYMREVWVIRRHPHGPGRRSRARRSPGPRPLRASRTARPARHRRAG